MNTYKDDSHNPSINIERFRDAMLTDDETGFTIPGTDFIFKFDEYKGWYDEYGNYFNMYGQNCEPPKRLTTSVRKDSGSNMLSDPAKEMPKPQSSFFPAAKLEEPEDEDDFIPRRGDDYNHFHRNTQNRSKIDLYPPHQDVDVEIERISLEFTEDSFKKDFLDKNNLKYKDVKFHYDESKGNAFDGVCTMTLPMESARKLILLNGTYMHGSSIRILVLNPRRQSDAVQIKSGGVIPMELDTTRGSERSSSGKSGFSIKLICQAITSCLQKKKSDHSIIMNEIE